MPDPHHPSLFPASFRGPRRPACRAGGAGVRRTGPRAALLSAFLVACSPQPPAPASAPAPAQEAAAPATAPLGNASEATPTTDGIYDHTLSDAEGKPQWLGQWKGKFLVLNFWATWCGPCVAEMPDLEKAQLALASRNVVIVGVGTEPAAKVREFRDQHGLHLTLLAGGYDALTLARSLGDTQGVLPYTVLVSPAGRVLQTQTGPLQPGQLRGWLATAP